ncbi:hypothetical protein EIP91_003426 [Steccherinum ochraceum]|uniref:WSC domain-containing protein n=1 Tax=Steccherinum ochraceum TaxID=92696 RepID=A0A4R0RIZ6_9APHY|nr:hypothetical protein EIP91_003426 [Steccherinum ochraceum]
MLPVALTTLFAVAVSAQATAQICRFVCPNIGQDLGTESLGSDGSAEGCFYPPSNGLSGFRFASYDSNGNLIPGSASSNNEGETRAGTFCTEVAVGWSFAQGQVCIADSPSSRILERDTFIPLPPSGNSPEACTAACDAQGFTLAGVEFGSECHCGTGFTATIAPSPHTNCNMVCTGNSSEVCGAPNLIQVFQGPDPPRAAQLPAGWHVFADTPCAQDSAARMFTDTLIAGPGLAASDTPAACVAFCAGLGFTKAGVEGGDECYCGTEFRSTPQALDPSLCTFPCQGAIGVTCGGDFAIELFELS